MLLRKFSLLPLAALLSTVAVGADLAFAGGVFRERAEGGCELATPRGLISVHPTWVAPGWVFNTIRGAKCSSALKDGNLVISFEAVAPAGFKTQDDLPMLIIVYGNGSAYSNGLFRLASKVVAFDRTCVWGYGRTFESDALRLKFLVDGERAISFWNNPKTLDWSIRVPTTAEKRPDGSVRYYGRIEISERDVKIPRPVDVVAQKRIQYRRVLVPPQERGFDATRWIALCEDTNTGNEDFQKLERLMDTRSELYSLADCIRHRENVDPRLQKLAAVAYKALSEMDVEKARWAVAALNSRMGGDSARTLRPLAAFSPFTWIKSFTQWGYVRHPGGHGNFEPIPWNLQWQDGFRFNVDQDARVAVANSASDRDFYETRFLEPMTDVSFERDWVSTKWHFADGKTVTFSLLTPIVDVDGIEELKLSGFSSPPEKFVTVDTRGREACIRLTKEAKYTPEVIPSALMDQSKPPPAAQPPSMGKIKINPEKVGRPWIRLVVQHDRDIILLPESRPTSVSWEKGVLTVTFARKGYVGILRAPENLYPGEYPEIAEFFARTAAAYPLACHEDICGTSHIWRYEFRERKNDWPLEPSRIAPVPPLLGFAELHCEGEKAFKYPTKWGLMRYVEGNAAKCILPSSLPREPESLRGVNSSIWSPVDKELAVITNGNVAVRLFTVKSKSVEESCRRFSEVLTVYRRHGIKAIIDAHNSVYGIWWDNGITPWRDFVKMWKAFSAVGARFKDVVVGYDLYNEPGIGGGSVEIWRQVCTEAARAILANHPEAKIYYPALAGGNPNGLANLRPMDIGEKRQVMTYHFYSPHSFTHQKSATFDIGGDTCVFYPAWAYPNDWGAGNHFGGTTVDWFDKWSLAAMMLPAFEHYAQYGIPLHVGEFSVIGYADGRSPRSAFLWTRDCVELFEHVGASWHLWNGGFGLCNESVRDWFFAKMRKTGSP